MGIIVPEAVLPNGITVSNVYMCLPSTIFYFPRSGDGSYQIGSQYKVYKDSTKIPTSDITFPITVTVSSVSNTSAHELLYEELKKTYNGYTDSIENVSVPLFPQPVVTVTQIGPTQVVMDENGAYIPTDKLVVEGEVPDIVAEML
jgi:hypothetical protein